MGKLNENLYHKDHFEYDYEQDTFKLPEINIYITTGNTQNHTKIQKNQTK